MPKKVYVGVDSKAKKVKRIYVGVDGKARKVKKGYIGIGGVARPFWSEGVAYYGTITSLSSKKYWAGAASVGTYALVAGGSKPTTSNGINAIAATNTVDAYNTSLQRTSAPTLTNARSQTVGATLNNYAVFSGNGTSTNKSVFAYNSALSKTDLTAPSTSNNYYQGAVSFGNTAIFSGGSGGKSLFLNSSMSLSQITATVSGTSTNFGGVAKVGNYAVTAFWLKVNNYNAGLSLQAFNSSGTQVQSASSVLISKWVCLDTANVGNYGLFFGFTTSRVTSSVESASKGQMTWCDSSLTLQTPIDRASIKSEFGKLCTNDYAILVGGLINAYMTTNNTVTKEVEVFDTSLTMTNELQIGTARRYIRAAAQVGSYGIFAAGETAYAGSINGTYSSDIVDAFTL